MTQEVLFRRLGWLERVLPAAIAAITPGYSPADLECVCRRALINSVVRGGGEVTLIDVGHAVDEVQPVLGEDEVEALRKWRPP